MFISLEGGDGTGKTTLARDLVRRLKAAGHSVVHVHEPGTTSLGLILRNWLKKDHKGQDALNANTELLLFLAARSDLVIKVVKPALLQEDLIVVADRYADSTIAYQGYGRGMPLEMLKALNCLATFNLNPDLTFLLDCPPETSLSRVKASMHKSGDIVRSDSENPFSYRGGTRFENESLEFHSRVHKGYRELAAEDPSRWVIVNAMHPPAQVSNDIWSHVLSRLQKP